MTHTTFLLDHIKIHHVDTNFGVTKYQHTRKIRKRLFIPYHFFFFLLKKKKKIEQKRACYYIRVRVNWLKKQNLFSRCGNHLICWVQIHIITSLAVSMLKKKSKSKHFIETFFSFLLHNMHWSNYKTFCVILVYEQKIKIFKVEYLTVLCEFCFRLIQ